MKHPTAETLISLQSKKRFALFLSLLFFLISLFALVSHWPVAYALIAFSCVFHLLSSQLYKRRYASAFIHALMEQAVVGKLASVTYAESENADGLLAAKGFTPNVPFVSGAKQHHVLHGLSDGSHFSIGEAVFLRKHGGRQMGSVGGTLVVADGVLPQDERWMIALGDPFAAVCTREEYVQGGYVESPPEETAPQDKNTKDSPALLLYQGKSAERLPACAAALRQMVCPSALALAACGGSLSLFLVGSYYAPSKIDGSKPFDPAMLKGARLPAFETMQKLMDAVR